MWDIDNFPGADHVPWQLLIRARQVREIDAVLASVIVEQVGAVASGKVTHLVASAAQASIAGGNREPATSEQRIAAFDAALDFDDWRCGTVPRRWPGPRPRFEDLSDPITDVVISRAVDLVQRAGSEELQKSLGSALAELSPAHR
ncbi:hypothetical protein ACVW00_004202 [Marmoricola sp. URHA0025 HA25]